MTRNGRYPYSGALILLVVFAVTERFQFGASVIADEATPSGKAADQLPSVKFASGHYTGPIHIPHIARFRSLPMRMMLEPEFELTPSIREVDPGHMPLFDRVLRESLDSDLQEQAALGLSILASGSLADISGSLDILKEQLQKSTDASVRHASAMAVVAAGDTTAAPLLLSLCEKEGDAFRLVAEPGLAGWKYLPAVEFWQRRLSDRFATSVSLRLACEGLTAMKDQTSLGLLQERSSGPAGSFSSRMAAARALGQLHPSEAHETGKVLATGTIAERLLAVQLFANQTKESIQQLANLCRDQNSGVAAAAWTAMYELDSNKLTEHLEYGRQHSDAVIRMTSARVMRLYPSPQRCEWLSAMLSDYHLEVRNTAREQLVAVAEENTALKEQMILAAADKLLASADDWQGIEQSLLVLGQLRSADYSDRCVVLLDHPRNEVAVSAAWLIHLYPDDAINEIVQQKIVLKDDLLNQIPVPPGTPAAESLNLQVAHLLQFAGLQRLPDLLPRMEKSFSKSEPGGIEKRSAAIWAISLVRENSNDRELVKKLESRVKDRSGMMPEQPLVRHVCVRALGIVRSVDSAGVLQEAYEVDPPEELIPHAARWALPLIGHPQPPGVPAQKSYVGGFRLNPSRSTDVK